MLLEHGGRSNSKLSIFEHPILHLYYGQLSTSKRLISLPIIYIEAKKVDFSRSFSAIIFPLTPGCSKKYQAR